MYRQGDLLIKKIDVLPAGYVNEKTDNVLVKGESTGHSHKLIGGKVIQIMSNLYMTIPEKGQLVHEEHQTIELEKGVYAVIRQREYVSKDEERTIYD